jgi:IS1 family transposase
MHWLPLGKQVQAVGILAEGASIRSVERITKIHRDTVMRLSLRAGEACAVMHDALVREVPSGSIQADEMWGFVRKKQAHLSPGDPAEWGDAWTFVAIDADTKLAISYLVEKRTPEATMAFMSDLRRRIVGRPQITTDGFHPYPDAIRAAFGDDVDHAVLLSKSEGRRVVCGSPDPALVSTSFVERQNLTMRMHIRRLGRSTSAHSKTLRGFRAAVALHFAVYNFHRVHMTLGVTPAMRAGLTTTVWSLEHLLRFAFERTQQVNSHNAER